MNIELKYKQSAIDDGVGTTDGWGYDLFEGGYIVPSEILKDKDRAIEIQYAIDLLMSWKIELDNDGILNDL